MIELKVLSSDRPTQILNEITKLERDFGRELKKSNRAAKKLFYPKSTVIKEGEFNKLSKEYKDSTEKAINLRKRINELKGEYHELTGKYTYQS